MRFEHYSSAAVEFDPDWDYSDRAKRYDKPTGFWVSVAGEDDWPSWCRSEEFRDIDNSVRHDVILSPSANLLVLDSPAAMREFDTEYGFLDSIGYSGYAIDWPRLYGEYDGIVIAPYQWSERYGELRWYSGWDCASGCVWNLGAITSVAVVPAESVAA